MTIEETLRIAKELYAEQGFLTISSSAPYTVGEEVIFQLTPQEQAINKEARWRVIGSSNLDENRRQWKIFGWDDANYYPYLHFYRIEAMD